jgi:hypothetical protein
VGYEMVYLLVQRIHEWEGRDWQERRWLKWCRDGRGETRREKVNRVREKLYKRAAFFSKIIIAMAHNNIFYSALTEHFSIVYGNSQLFYLLVHFTLAQSKRFQKKKFENISL